MLAIVTNPRFICSFRTARLNECESKMGKAVKPEAIVSNRRFVLADNLRPRAWHELQKTESGFGAPTPATRHFDGRDDGMTADPELQSAIKQALSGLNS